MRFLAGLGLMACSGFALAAASVPATNAPSATPPQHAAASAASPPTINPAPLPLTLQGSLTRYGNIVGPSDQVPYPLRLRLPNPTDTEVHLPKPEDLLKRAKLEALASLSDDDIRKQLAAWPAYSKMSLRDQGAMLQRIQDFRDYHARVAMQKAHDMGLLTLTPTQQAKFEKDYWNKRLKMDQDLIKQFQPVYQAREQQMNTELFREFSSAMPAPGPPTGKPSVPVPPKSGPSAKTPQTSTASTATNSATPIAQSPH